MQAPTAASGFVDELQRAYELIKRNPDAASPRLEAELGMSGLRSWKLPRYPCLIVYFRHPDVVDVVDVPHTRTNYVPRCPIIWVRSDHPAGGEHRLHRRPGRPLAIPGMCVHGAAPGGR